MARTITLSLWKCLLTTKNLRRITCRSPEAHVRGAPKLLPGMTRSGPIASLAGNKDDRHFEIGRFQVRSASHCAILATVRNCISTGLPGTLRKDVLRCRPFFPPRRCHFGVTASIPVGFFTTVAFMFHNALINKGTAMGSRRHGVVQRSSHRFARYFSWMRRKLTAPAPSGSLGSAQKFRAYGARSRAAR